MIHNLIGIVHSGALIALIAHGMIGISLVWDKVLLKNPGTKNLYSYVFWLGSLSIFGVILVPFGYKSISLRLIVIAFAAGVLDLAASYFYYAALKQGEASETLAMMGGFSPLATALLALALLSEQMTSHQLWGFALMTVGGFVMFFSEKLALKKVLPPVLLASGMFGLANVLSKLVYDQTNFVSGYVWFAIGTFAGSMSLLVRPSCRRQIFAESAQSTPRNRFWYFVNRFMAGVGSFLVFYAISLTHPAVVNAISGVRYAIIFIGAYLLTKFKPAWLSETFRGWQLVTKSMGTSLVIAGVVIVGLAGAKSGSSSTATNLFKRGELRIARKQVAQNLCGDIYRSGYLCRNARRIVAKSQSCALRTGADLSAGATGMNCAPVAYGSRNVRSNDRAQYCNVARSLTGLEAAFRVTTQRSCSYVSGRFRSVTDLYGYATPLARMESLRFHRSRQ